MDKSHEIISADNDIKELITASSDLIRYARSLAAKQVNLVQLMTYYSLGRWIVEVEQKGQSRAKYGRQVIKSLSLALNEEFGRGFSADTLEHARRFYLTYKDRISETVFRKFAVEKSETAFRKFEDDAPASIRGWKSCIGRTSNLNVGGLVKTVIEDLRSAHKEFLWEAVAGMRDITVPR